jgi:6-pyruvoyl-tetrahydropterin synthase
MFNLFLILFQLLSLCSVATWALQDKGFSLGIRDSIMIAHSFNGEQFGPAQNMHGATYTVDVDLFADDLVDKSNWVIDIGEFSSILSEVLNKYNFKNLNELFPNDNTTTEYMCKVIHNDLCHRLKGLNFCGNCRVKLFESHKAWAAYSGNVLV